MEEVLVYLAINSKPMYYISIYKIQSLLNVIFLPKYKLHVLYGIWSLGRIRWYIKMGLQCTCNYSIIKFLCGTYFCFSEELLSVVQIYSLKNTIRFPSPYCGSKVKKSLCQRVSNF